MNSKVSVSLTSFSVLFAVAAVAAPCEDADKEIAGKQQAKRFESDAISGNQRIKVELDYLLYLPPDYRKSGKAWPLVMFLHGSGAVGNDIKRVLAIGPARMAEAKKFPFILLSPQSPQRGWNVNSLNALLDDVVSKHHVDKDRLYLT